MANIKHFRIINGSGAHYFIVALSVLMVLAGGVYFYKLYDSYRGIRTSLSTTETERDNLEKNLDELMNKYDVLTKDFEDLKNEDQVKVNRELRAEMANLQKGFERARSVYTDLLNFRDRGGKTYAMEVQLATAINQLSDRKYAEAVTTLDKIAASLQAEQAKTVAAVTIPANVPVVNTPPSSGYSRQQVATSIGNYLVSMVAGDLSNTKIIVDTASDSTCANDCPVLPLATYVSRSGAYAGINGSYFCPATYPDCASKKNSFDLLVMNKNKVYFNSDNNVYSNNPGVIFGGGYIRFVSAVSQWGRDTGIDSMISNYPLLVSGGNISFGGDTDPKKGSKGNRSFVANKGSQVFIGVVHSATVAEGAVVLKTLGMENALNLDNGGSTALWSGGYKVGPGRDLPNVVLFVRK
ncbi:MAG: hypothetical protein UX12_C0009G0008 [Candidatus Collierbacteria bacterium GW2011_GWC1_45_47]|uniref:Phosphodiester glycosidase domain-containing protein n=5 Tax=Candidatus Collieribacteriota TaxID=1752725 RepID=A0A0G1HJE2_9BACT|nr:MAG: hypothetical protein UW26_C0006G0013 [Candidatus Collierbacteria bacterium GW2011_GWF1_44_12]KKT46663.1 MAG: hypothetical protein UW35_C0010G0020 [Candidatus Collierbacteria bacterium GW2011_GWF2_44_15]KKT67954.1 MAG: hypothetical protein UW62_C0009G0007 [Candidatus Collierbacteria bacterium GW2011_GWB1_44_35]KKU00319.1 MAG: hypothetical protein UW99_C0002G0021 [Candidatus Collierbacteria bacterium GW2011_GWC2_45_15]KKU09540.1 MAG: hypothetical protein UX12_C0009G0008 [Candidatus Collie